MKRQKLYNKYCKELEEDLNSYVKKGKYRTTDKYISLFDNSRNYKYRGESSHYIYSPDTAIIIKKKSPQSKIIISVRNPIDRMYSEYLYHSRIEGQSKLDFGSYVNDNLPGIIMEAPFVRYARRPGVVVVKGLEWQAI